MNLPKGGGAIRGIGEEFAVAFSPDGRWLATVSRDSTARLRTLPVDLLIAKARRAARRNLALEEWQRFFPGEPFIHPHRPAQYDRAQLAWS